MKVIARFKGTEIEIKLSQNPTLEDFRSAIAANQGVTPSQIRIIHKSKILKENLPLKDYGIEDGGSLNVICSSVLSLYSQIKQTEPNPPLVVDEVSTTPNYPTRDPPPETKPTPSPAPIIPSSIKFQPPNTLPPKQNEPMPNVKKTLPYEDALLILQNMGFDEELSKLALIETNGNIEEAINCLTIVSLYSSQEVTANPMNFATIKNQIPPSNQAPSPNKQKSISHYISIVNVVEELQEILNNLEETRILKLIIKSINPSVGRVVKNSPTGLFSILKNAQKSKQVLLNFDPDQRLLVKAVIIYFNLQLKKKGYNRKNAIEALWSHDWDYVLAENWLRNEYGEPIIKKIAPNPPVSLNKINRIQNNKNPQIQWQNLPLAKI